MGFALLTLFTALLISGMAAWVAIIGMVALFSAQSLMVAIIIGLLELGKLVTASWLYRNWKNCSKKLKIPGVLFVIVLMFLTSMGAFGFLSKAHLDQVLPTGETTAKIERIKLSIKREQRQIDDADLVLGQLDKVVQVLIDYDVVRGPTGSIATRKSQKEERAELTATIKSAEQAIDKLVDKKFPYEQTIRILEAEVGPIKYVAEAIYGNTDETFLGKAVRFVILIIVFVFDPLAVWLLIAANRSLLLRKPEKIPPAEYAEWLEMKNPFREKKGIADEK